MRDAAIAAGTAGGLLAGSVLVPTAIFATAPYGRSWASHVVRTAGPYMGLLGAPAAAAAGTSMLLGNGSAGVLGGVAAGGLAGAALGATALHGFISKGGTPIARGASAALIGMTGLFVGGMAATLTNLVHESSKQAAS